MLENTGFIKLFRSFKKWQWYTDTNVKILFLHLLLSASYKDFEWRGQVLKGGELITSIGHLANELDISVQQVRTALKKLTDSGEISVNTTNKFTVIKVMKWEDYQVYDGESNKQITNKEQTNNNQITNEQQHNKNNKNIKNKNNYSARGRAREHSCENSGIDWSLVEQIIAAG